jgi:hypothetical protein
MSEGRRDRRCIYEKSNHVFHADGYRGHRIIKLGSSPKELVIFKGFKVSRGQGFQ